MIWILYLDNVEGDFEITLRSIWFLENVVLYSCMLGRGRVLVVSFTEKFSKLAAHVIRRSQDDRTSAKEHEASRAAFEEGVPEFNFSIDPLICARFICKRVRFGRV